MISPLVSEGSAQLSWVTVEETTLKARRPGSLGTGGEEGEGAGRELSVAEEGRDLGGRGQGWADRLQGITGMGGWSWEASPSWWVRQVTREL